MVAVFGAAGLQLTLVSGVWFGPKGRPKGKMKLAIYFVQVGDANSRFGTGPVQVVSLGVMWLGRELVRV